MPLTLTVEKARTTKVVNRKVFHFVLKTEAKTLKLYDQQGHVTDVDNLVIQELLVCIKQALPYSVKNLTI